MDLGFSCQIKLEVGDDFIVVADELQIDRNAFGGASIGELLRDPFPVGPIGDSLFGRGKIVLMMGVLDMRHQLATLPDHSKPSS